MEFYPNNKYGKSEKFKVGHRMKLKVSSGKGLFLKFLNAFDRGLRRQRQLQERLLENVRR